MEEESFADLRSFELCSIFSEMIRPAEEMDTNSKTGEPPGYKFPPKEPGARQERGEPKTWRVYEAGLKEPLVPYDP